VSMSPSISTAFPRAIVTSSSKSAVRAGRVLSGIAVAFLTLDAAMKLLQVPAAVEGTVQLGYPMSSLITIGLIQVACLAVYLVPRTAILGAVLWTGYLGGHCHPCARRQPALHAHPLSDLRRGAAVGRPLAARPASSRRLRGAQRLKICSGGSMHHHHWR